MMETGQIIRCFREEHHLSQSMICGGLCSISTLSRIENEEHQIDVFLQEALLSRIGVQLRRLEVVVEKEEFDLYERRYKIRQLARMEKWSELAEATAEYRERMPKEIMVHHQFLQGVHAFHLKKTKRFEESFLAYVRALELTVKREEALQGKRLLNVQEMSLLLDMGECFLYLKEDKGRRIFAWIIHYYEKHRLYEPRIVAQSYYLLGKYYMHQQEFDRAERMFQKGIEGTLESRYIYLRGKIHLLRAKCLEEMKREEAAEEFIKAYYLLSEQYEEKMCRKIEEHVKVKYPWVSI